MPYNIIIVYIKVCRHTYKKKKYLVPTPIRGFDFIHAIFARPPFAMLNRSDTSLSRATYTKKQLLKDVIKPIQYLSWLNVRKYVRGSCNNTSQLYTSLTSSSL